MTSLDYIQAMSNETVRGKSDYASAESRAADAVVEQLEARIFSGELADGKPLPAERELIAEFGVSRTVAREAVTMLASKGLIDARPRHRPVVRRPDYDTALGVLGGIVRHLLEQKGGVKHLFDTRILVETALVRFAAEQADKDDIANLRAALARNGEAVLESERFYETDMAFHSVLYTIPKNPILPALHKAYTGWLADHWKQMPRLPERNRHNFQAHSAILDGILNRDPDAVEDALRRHLTDAWEQVRATFDNL